MTKMNLTNATILQMFKTSMNATKSATNLRRARGEIRNLEAVAKAIHQDNVKHMYSKRMHKNAGDFIVDGPNVTEQVSTTNIVGDVTINIKGTRKAAQ